MAKPQISEEARARIEREAKEMRDRVMSGNSIFDKPEKKEPKPKRAPQPKTLSTRTREAHHPGRRMTEVEIDEIVRLYTEEEYSVGEVAKSLESTVETVRRYLKLREVWVEGNHGRPKLRFCKRGHDQKEHRKWRQSRGYYCDICDKTRNLGYQKAERAKLKDNRLEHLSGDRWQVWVEGDKIGVLDGTSEVVQALDDKLRALSATRGKKHD